MKCLFIALLLLSSLSQASPQVENIKKQIFMLAESYKGQGDADGSKQKKLEELVEDLLVANPQPPVRERLHLLYGPWKQIWGPYEYGKNTRGVDLKIDPNNIYQVIFREGYYYNVNPSLDKNGNPQKIVLLRGEFRLNSSSDDSLRVKFTNLREIKSLPQNGLRLQDLPALSESRQLPGEKTTLPAPVVRLLFGGGHLQEVYTDHNLRITFGSGNNDKVSDYIYILKRPDSKP